MNTDIHGLAGAYALHALTDIERAAFDRHLADCETCALEVRELRETAARIGEASFSVPPPRLRQQVLAEIRQTRQVGPGRPERRAPAELVRWRRLTTVAAAAAIFAAAVGGVSFLLGEQRVREQRAVAEAARADAVAAQAEASRMAAILNAPDAVLRGRNAPAGGHVSVVYSPSHNTGVAMLDKLPAPPPGHTYQLWVMGDQPVSAGVVPDGLTSFRHTVTGLRGANALGVTVEPAGGSVSPNMDTAITLGL
ncbi:anti-sigma factor [Pilimelia columellifera]|uniref:Regulator of SigK n=1 Tax=Pilimelia columellifera subsp. columellifera TaxID=706583 RepID=A0ABN3NJ22_9ACTN